jgi:6-phosphogluconolactonase (cycloisomerase 2 family)
VSFTPDGRQLIVTEKGTRLLDIFFVLANGNIQGPFAQTSLGKTPFGFAFGPGNSVIISEAQGGFPSQSTTSSYHFPANPRLQPVSRTVHDNGTAACWVVVTGDVAWVVNTASANISSYNIASDGRITLANSVAASIPGTVPIDAAASSDNQFLYQVLSTTGQIQVFGINGDLLTPLSIVNNLPLSIQGIVAR